MRTSKFTMWCVAVGSATLLSIIDAHAQVTAYPAHGQTAEQQAKDKADCQQFAKEQTGFDPQVAMAEQPTPPPAHAVRPRKKAKEEQKELSQEQQQQQQMKQKLSAYNKAESVCLQGKGYSVG